MRLGHRLGAANGHVGRRRLSAALTAVAVAIASGCVPEAAAASPTLVAAGDIACAPPSVPNATTCQQGATAALVQSLNPTAVAALGDEQYNSGTAAEFTGGFAPTWGAFQPLIFPVPGNHEYLTPGAAGYFGYFGAVAGNPSQGYYSYDLGAWHILALNSNCEFVSCAVGSAQEQWVRADLAAHPAVCTLAYWHHPLFTSGPTAGGADNLGTRPLWQALLDGGADVILNGHDHDYERFAPQDASGQPDPGGIREFVVGTGGKSLFTFGPLAANSQVHDNTSFGVLELTLDPTAYSWRFVPATGSFSDSGTAPCSDLPPAAVLSVSSTSATVGQALAFDGSGSTDRDGAIVSARIDFGDGASAAASTAVHAYAKPGSYAASLLVTDNGGQSASVTQIVHVMAATGLGAPRLKLAVARHTLAHALRYGLRLTATPSRPGRLDVLVRLEPRVAQTLGLGRAGHAVTVAGARGRALSGPTKITLAFTHAARNRLGRLHHVTLTLKATFTAKDGRTVIRSTTITLRR